MLNSNCNLTHYFPRIQTCIPISAFEAHCNCLPMTPNMRPSSANTNSIKFIHPSTRLRTSAKACSCTEGSGSAMYMSSKQQLDLILCLAHKLKTS